MPTNHVRSIEEMRALGDAERIEALASFALKTARSLGVDDHMIADCFAADRCDDAITRTWAAEGIAIDPGAVRAAIRRMLAN